MRQTRRDIKMQQLDDDFEIMWEAGKSLNERKSLYEPNAIEQDSRLKVRQHRDLIRKFYAVSDQERKLCMNYSEDPNLMIHAMVSKFRLAGYDTDLSGKIPHEVWKLLLLSYLKGHRIVHRNIVLRGTKKLVNEVHRPALPGVRIRKIIVKLFLISQANIPLYRHINALSGDWIEVAEPQSADLILSSLTTLGILIFLYKTYVQLNRAGGRISTLLSTCEDKIDKIEELSDGAQKMMESISKLATTAEGMAPAISKTASSIEDSVEKLTPKITKVTEAVNNSAVIALGFRVPKILQGAIDLVDRAYNYVKDFVIKYITTEHVQVVVTAALVVSVVYAAAVYLPALFDQSDHRRIVYKYAMSKISPDIVDAQGDDEDDEPEQTALKWFGRAMLSLSEAPQLFNQWWKAFGAQASTFNSIYLMMERMTKLIVPCFEWIYEKVMHQPWNSAKTDVQCVQASIESLTGYANQLAQGLPLTTMIAQGVVEEYQKLQKYSLLLSKLQDQSMASMVIRTLAVNLDLYGKCSSFFSHQVTRPMPMWIHLAGKPGVGKTTLKDILLQMIHMQVLGKAYDSHSVFDRKVANDFWDGYNNQPIVVYDDLLQRQEPKDARAAESLELIYGVNTNPYHLHMSAISEKQVKYFTSQVIISTSNVDNTYLPTNLGLTDEGALYRRMAMKFLVSKKDNFVEDPNDDIWQDACKRYHIAWIHDANRLDARPIELVDFPKVFSKMWNQKQDFHAKMSKPMDFGKYTENFKCQAQMAGSDDEEEMETATVVTDSDTDSYDDYVKEFHQQQKPDARQKQHSMDGSDEFIMKDLPVTQDQRDAFNLEAQKTELYVMNYIRDLIKNDQKRDETEVNDMIDKAYAYLNNIWNALDFEQWKLWHLITDQQMKLVSSFEKHRYKLPQNHKIDMLHQFSAFGKSLHRMALDNLIEDSTYEHQQKSQEKQQGYWKDVPRKGPMAGAVFGTAYRLLNSPVGIQQTGKALFIIAILTGLAGIVLGLIIRGVMALYNSLFGPTGVISQSLDPRSERRHQKALMKKVKGKAGYKVPKTINQKKVITAAQMDEGMASLISRVASNTEYVGFEAEGKMLRQHILFVTGTSAFTASHVFLATKIKRLFFFWGLATEKMDGGFWVSENDYKVTLFDDTDLCRIDFVEGIMPLKKDLTRHIPERTVEDEVTGQQVSRISFTPDGHYFLERAQGAAVKEGCCSTTTSGWQKEFDLTYRIPGIQGKSGDCGLAYFAQRMEKKLRFLHVAGSGNDSWAAPLYQDYLPKNNTVICQSSLGDPIFPRKSGLSFSYSTEKSKYDGMKVVGKLNKNIYLNQNSDLVPSIVQQPISWNGIWVEPPYKVEKVPTKMKRFFKKDQEGNLILVDPLANGMSRLKGRIAPERVQFVDDDWKGVFDHVNWNNIVQPLTTTQAVLGVEGDEFLGPMDTSTSSSLGFQERGVTLRDLIGVEEDGTRYIKEELTDYVLDQELAVEREEIPPYMGTVAVKSELKLEGKEEKPRIFVNGEKGNMIRSKKYLGPIFKEICQDGTKGDVAVGINPHGWGWTAMFRQMGDDQLIIATDAVAWDFNLRYYIATGFYHQLDKRMKAAKGRSANLNFWLRQIKAILDTVLVPWVILGDVVLAYLGMPSGSFVTAILNSIGNSVMGRAAYRLKAQPIIKKTFDEVCKQKCFGDDLFLRIFQQYLHIWNSNTLAKACLELYGLELTTILKNGTQMKDALTFKVDTWDPEAAQFLKRQFRYENGIVYPILDPVSIRSMVLWIRPTKVMTDNMLLKQNIETAMREWAYYGEEKYNEEWGKLQPYYQQVACSGMLPFTFVDLRTAVVTY